MKEKILEKIFKNLEILTSKSWVISRKKALKSAEKMRIEQEKLTIDEARAEAVVQATRMRNERFKENENR